MLSSGAPTNVLPDAGALDDFEGLGLNDASPEYGADAEDSEAGSPSVEGAGEEGKLHEDGLLSSPSSTSSPITPETAPGSAASGAGGEGGVVDVKAPIEEQEAVGIPDPIEIEVWVLCLCMCVRARVCV